MTHVVSAASMLSNTALSVGNYDAMLIVWSTLSLQHDVVLDATGVSYCGAGLSRNTIITNFGWTINDAGQSCVTTVSSAGTGGGRVVPVVTVTGLYTAKPSFVISSVSNKVANLTFDVDSNTLRGYVVGLLPDTSVAQGIIPYVGNKVTFKLPDTAKHIVYVKFYSTTGKWSPVLSQQTPSAKKKVVAKKQIKK